MKGRKVVVLFGTFPRLFKPFRDQITDGNTTDESLITYTPVSAFFTAILLTGINTILLLH